MSAVFVVCLRYARYYTPAAAMPEEPRGETAEHISAALMLRRYEGKRQKRADRRAEAS